MRIDLLDHGYVEFIEAWGTGKEGLTQRRQALDGVFEPDYEVGIVEAARQSTQGSFRGWGQDAKLLKRLYENNHATPFEFAGMVIEVQAPIFVFREWHRHRTQSYNEMSARYEPLPDLYYHVDPQVALDRAVAAQREKNKQASAAVKREIDEEEVVEWLARDEDLSMVLEEHYRKGLSIGIPKELARKKMPVDHYSRMRASANLRNWLAFMTLRCDPLAQWELQRYAGVVSKVISHGFPQTHALWLGQQWSSNEWPK